MKDKRTRQEIIYNVELSEIEKKNRELKEYREDELEEIKEVKELLFDSRLSFKRYVEESEYNDSEEEALKKIYRGEFERKIDDDGSEVVATFRDVDPADPELFTSSTVFEVNREKEPSELQRKVEGKVRKKINRKRVHKLLQAQGPCKEVFDFIDDNDLINSFSEENPLNVHYQEDVGRVTMFLSTEKRENLETIGEFKIKEQLYPGNFRKDEVLERIDEVDKWYDEVQSYIADFDVQKYGDKLEKIKEKLGIDAKVLLSFNPPETEPAEIVFTDSALRPILISEDLTKIQFVGDNERFLHETDHSDLSKTIRAKPERGREGDWIVRGPEGKIGIIDSDKDFTYSTMRTFEVVEEKSNCYIVQPLSVPDKMRLDSDLRILTNTSYEENLI